MIKCLLSYGFLVIHPLFIIYNLYHEMNIIKIEEILDELYLCHYLIIITVQEFMLIDVTWY